MSCFMLTMLALGLSERPPESKQTPLPTRQSVGARRAPFFFAALRGGAVLEHDHARLVRAALPHREQGAEARAS